MLLKLTSSQFQHILKTRMILILNFTRPHAITYTKQPKDGLTVKTLEESASYKSKMLTTCILSRTPWRPYTVLYTFRFKETIPLTRYSTNSKVYSSSEKWSENVVLTTNCQRCANVGGRGVVAVLNKKQEKPFCF